MLLALALTMSAASPSPAPAPVAPVTPVTSVTSVTSVAPGLDPAPREVKLDLGEASGVAALAGGGFVVVDDERGVLLVPRDRQTVLGLAGPSPEQADPRALKDLEGVCVIAGVVVVVAEGSGIVSGITLAGVVRRLGALPHPPTPKPKANKGWEGLAFLPARLATDGKDHLVAVHEDRPKAVALFAWPSLSPEVTLPLSAVPALDEALADLSDVAVDPATGDLLLLSDESRRLVRVGLQLGAVPALRLGSARTFPVLPVGAGEKPEGVTVDDAGVVWIVTDQTGRLLPLPAAPH